MNRRAIGSAIALAVTTAGVGWLVATGALEPVLAGLATADLRVLALVLPLVVLLQFARAKRFILLLERLRSGGLMATFRISCVHIALNLLLPFKLGEAAFPLLARRIMGIDLATGTGTLLTARLLDLGTLFALLAAALALLGPLVLLVLARAVQRYLPRFGAVGEVLARAQARHTFWQATAWSMFIWACHAGAAWLAFVALGQPVDVAIAVFAGASANLAFALPFQGIAGLGPVQAAFAWAASASGVPLEDAITVALACHASLLVSGCLLGLLGLIGEPRLQWWRGQ